MDDLFASLCKLSVEALLRCGIENNCFEQCASEEEARSKRPCPCVMLCREAVARKHGADGERPTDLDGLT